MESLLTLLGRRDARGNVARADVAESRKSDHSAFGGDLDHVRNLVHLAVRQAVTGARSGVRRDDALAECLRAVCSEGRDAGLRVEQLIIMIKQSWRSLAGAEALTHRVDELTLTDVVTRCIDEFYRASDDAPRR